VPFDYYRNLSAKQRKTYRESDKIAQVDLGDVSGLRPGLVALREALEADDRRQVQRACATLARGITDALGISRVRVRVGGRRPVDADGAELFGQCSWDEEETKGALVELWMRTAKRGQAVAFKTLVRTLIHELGHHLDYELHGLDNTFHTEGFFRRESSLFRQVVGEAAMVKPEPTPAPAPEPVPEPEPEPEPELGLEPARSGQLNLPF